MQTVQEFVGFGHAQAERRKETDNICTADSGKYFLFEQQFLADFLDGVFKFQSDHQTASAYFLDAFEFLQFLHEVSTYTSGVLYQIFCLHDIQYSDGCRTCQVVSTECGT